MKINIERGSFLSSLEMGVKTKIKQSGGVVNSTPSVITNEEKGTNENVILNGGIDKLEGLGYSNKDNIVSDNEIDNGDFEFDMDSDEEDYTVDTEEVEDYDIGSDDDEEEYDMDSDDEEYDMDSDDEEYEFPDDDDEEEYDMDSDDDEEEYDMDSDDDDAYDMGSEDGRESDNYEEFEFDMDSEDEEEYEFPDEDEFDIDVDGVENFDMDSEDEEDYDISPEEDDFKETTSIFHEPLKVQNSKQPSRTIPVETKDDDLNSLLNTIETPKPNVKVKSVTNNEVAENKENTGIVYHEGMKFDDFLRKNPSIRSEKDVLDYYSKEELKFYIRTGKVLFKKGRFIL